MKCKLIAKDELLILKLFDLCQVSDNVADVEIISIQMAITKKRNVSDNSKNCVHCIITKGSVCSGSRALFSVLFLHNKIRKITYM